MFEISTWRMAPLLLSICSTVAELLRKWLDKSSFRVGWSVAFSSLNVVPLTIFNAGAFSISMESTASLHGVADMDAPCWFSNARSAVACVALPLAARVASLLDSLDAAGASYVPHVFIDGFGT